MREVDTAVPSPLTSCAARREKKARKQAAVACERARHRCKQGVKQLQGDVNAFRMVIASLLADGKIPNAV